MENQITNAERKYNKNTTAGFVLLFVGLAFLLKHADFVFFPHWLFSWPLILIAVGLAIGAKHNFKKNNWIVITGLGVLFLLPNIIPSLHVVVLWPLLLIALGFRLVTRHNERWNGTNWEKRSDAQFNNFDKSI